MLALAAPAVASAQNGRISGTVTQRESGVPLASARVTVVGTAFGAMTDAAGRYTIVEVTPGTYEVTVQRIGQRMTSVPNVTVRAGQVTRVDASLEQTATELAGVVVSASRRVEKITEAPATITRIDARAIENTVGNSFSGALKGVEGVDFVQVGITSAAINTRGFNSSFNNRVLMMEDGRIAVLPENGLPVGSFTTIPKVDLAAVEVLVGPGSALYGPDASNGVVTLETKDPKQYPGSTIEIAGGSRSYMDVQGRHAGVFSNGSFGYKLTGEYQSAKDFTNHNVYAPVVVGGVTTQAPELNADWDTNVLRGAGALDYYMGDARIEANLGASKSNGIGPTNVGRNQLKDWQYRHAQLKYTSPHWFGQLYKAQSRSGETYQLNGFAQNRVRFPTLSEDSVRHLSDFPAAGDLNAAELQNNFAVPMIGTHLTYGGQFRQDVVSSKRQWLVDRQTGKDITIKQKGVYAQLEQNITPLFRVIAAGRYDKHDYYKAQWSPKAGLLFMPIPDQTLRFTFNRAFKSPTILQTGFYFPNFSPGIGLEGNRYGFDIKNAAGVTLVSYAPIAPETNDTYEVGYKGIALGKLFVDVTGYRTFYKNFMTPLVVIANPFTGNAATATYAYQRGTKFVSETGGDQITLTYLNLGKARIDGIDMGVRYLLTPGAVLSGTMSHQKLKDVQTPTNFTQATRDEATAFNSPTFKWNLGADLSDVAGTPLMAGFNARHVAGYNFRSGVNFGYIPAFSTIDLSFGYKLPMQGTRLNVNVQNLFACVSGETTPNQWIASGRPSIYKPDSKCGFGKQHTEMLNMPSLGTMVFVGLRWDR
jgi:iron complex outermembrane receptor protein